MSGGMGELVPNVLCIAAMLAAVVGAIRLRQRVGRLPGSPAAGPRGRRGGEHDAHPREIDDASDDGDDGDGDGGEA